MNNKKDSLGRKPKRRLKKPSRKKRIILSIIIVILIFFTGRMLTLEYRYYTLNKEKHQISEQIEDENLKSKELNEELDSSESKSYIEYLAKKYLGLIYPDEKVYVINEGDNE